MSFFFHFFTAYEVRAKRKYCNRKIGKKIFLLTNVHVLYILELKTSKKGRSVCRSVRPSVFLYVCLAVCMPACIYVCLPVCPSVCPSVFPSVCLPVRQAVCVSRPYAQSLLKELAHPNIIQWVYSMYKMQFWCLNSK